MFSLFAHHAKSFFALEINGREYPDGMTEHVIGIALGVFALVLMSYGLYAGIRDVLRWRRKAAEVKA
jgi:hypothetical protein